MEKSISNRKLYTKSLCKSSISNRNVYGKGLYLNDESIRKVYISPKSLYGKYIYYRKVYI